MLRIYISTIYVYNLPWLCIMNVNKSNNKKKNGFTLKKKQATEIMTDADYTDDLALLANIPVQDDSLLYSLEQAAGGIGLYMNTNKTEFMNFKQGGAIFTWSSKPLKLVDQSTTESNVNICIAKVWTPIDKLSIIWKSDLTDKIKWDFFQAVVVSILLYGSTTWTNQMHE